MRHMIRPAALGAVGLAGVLACAPADSERERVLFVTTTSVEASGLLGEITTRYHAHQRRYRLSTAAAGSGAALTLGGRGDADLLLTHDPAGERRFLERYPTARQGPVMVNDFLIAGPPSDPARIGGMTDAAQALQRLAGGGFRFVSRGDDSGTHLKEREVWRDAGLEPWIARAPWYIESGTGMEETLQMATELRAYTLTDRGSFLHLTGRHQLASHVEGDPRLRNPYTYTLPVSPRNPDGARDFLAWLTGPGQEVIRQYGVARHGRPLFEPAAHRPESALPAPSSDR